MKGVGCVLTLAATLIVARDGSACGASTGGIAGIGACSLAEHQEDIRLKFRVGMTGSWTTTAIKFSGGLRAGQERFLGIVTGDYRPMSTLTLQVGVGPFFGGDMHLAGIRYNLVPGVATAAAVSWRVVDPLGARPFVVIGGQISAVFTGTQSNNVPVPESASYQALDFRGSVAVGWAIADILGLYAVGRVFGGPVFWHVNGASVLGTDTYHYQVGGGVSVVLGRRVDLFAEGIAAGERGASVGLGVSL